MNLPPTFGPAPGFTIDADDGSGLVRKSAIFGQLVTFAIPHVQHYVGDLFHDATWLNEHIPRLDPNDPHATFEFYFGWRDTGTSIGTDFTPTRYSNDHVVHCKVHWSPREGGRTWSRLLCTFTPAEPDPRGMAFSETTTA